MYQFVPEIDSAVLKFCARLSPQETPVYVPVRVHAKTSPLNCFLDVRCLVAEEGGDMVSGWEISLVPKMYLEAQAHAVWRNKSGSLISISPPEIETKRILFLPDRNLEYKGVQIPNERFALGSKDLIDKYLFYMDAAKGLPENRAIQFILRAKEIRNEIQRA